MGRAPLNVNRTSRNWRYHKDLMMWVTKDQSLPDPIPISAEAEKGSYVFFNHMTWNRVRVSLDCEGLSLVRISTQIAIFG